MLLETLFLISILFGCAGAYPRRRPDGGIDFSQTAWALLGGAVITSSLPMFGVGFNPWIWLLVDIAVVAAIAASPRPFTGCDLAVVLLFLPSGGMYFTDAQWAVDLTTIIVSLQFFLTFPWGWCVSKARREKCSGKDPPDRLLRVTHA